MRYYIQSNDGRFVTQYGRRPALTKTRAMAYVWPTAEDAARRLPEYLKALEAEGVLALAVMAGNGGEV